MLNLRSDNSSPVHERVRQAMIDDLLQLGTAACPGDYDTRLDGEVEAALGALFGRDLAAVPVATGTGANALALATLGHGRRDRPVICHEDAHVRQWEDGAALRLGGFADFTAVGGANGKIAPDALAAAIRRSGGGGVLTLTNPTEVGVLYSLAEMEEIAAIAAEHGLRLHLDGARLGNCLAALGITARELAETVRFDALSFGGTKVGGFAADAVVLFEPEAELVATLATLQRAGGQRQAKRRLTQVQILALLDDDLWLQLARRQNALCRSFVDAASPSLRQRIKYPPDVNQLFLASSAALLSALEQGEIGHAQWDESTIRLVFGHEHAEETIRAAAAELSNRLGQGGGTEETCPA